MRRVQTSHEIPISSSDFSVMLGDSMGCPRGAYGRRSSDDHPTTLALAGPGEREIFCSLPLCLSCPY